MKPSSCNHCLRPTQTSRIAEELLEQRRPINLIGKPGQSRGRFLEDLMGIDPDAEVSPQNPSSASAGKEDIMLVCDPLIGRPDPADQLIEHLAAACRPYQQPCEEQPRV